MSTHGPTPPGRTDERAPRRLATLVFDRQLTPAERAAVEALLAMLYDVPLPRRPDA